MTYRWRVPSPLLRYAVRPLGAILGGLALWLAFPDHDLWPLAPAGVALVGAATWRAGFRRGFVLGLLAGLACFVPTLSWSGIYVGALPWLALSTLQALYVALMGGLVGWGSGRLATRGWWHAAYLLVPLGWVAQELARSTTPWGGFPWARLAFSQSDGPLVRLAAFGGAPGVTFAVALLGTTLLALGHALARRATSRHPAMGMPPWSVALGWFACAGIIVVGSIVAVPPTGGRQARVGFVQGNVPHPGLDFNAERRAVLDNHVRGTLALAARDPSGMSLVVWPENSSDIDPFRNPDARAQIDRAVDAVGVPIMVGAVLAEPPGHNSNVSLLYRPGGGEPERYTKLHPVPFAEYIPYRSFFSRFSSAAHLAGNFIAGDHIGAFEIEDAASGPYWALPTICFEVAYDGLMRDSVLNPRVNPGVDASLLVVQTNNATFGYTAESEQQFAISRLRAVEHGRSVIHVSTVGVSGLIDPDGSVSAKTRLFTADQAVVSATLRTATTMSDRLGPWPERVAVAAFAMLLALGLVGGRRGARHAPAPRTVRVGDPGAARLPAADPIEDDIRA